MKEEGVRLFLGILVLMFFVVVGWLMYDSINQPENLAVLAKAREKERKDHERPLRMDRLLERDEEIYELLEKAKKEKEQER